MSAFFPRRFSSPESVKRISPKNLLALLAPSREYLAGRGLVLPQEANDPVDYVTLVAILVDPSPDMPKSLIDGLYFVHEMSTPECMADLLEAAAPGVLDFEEGEEPTPADVAVQVWLKDRDLLESKHAERFLVRSKTFIFYPGSAQTRQQPELTEAVRISIQDDLDVWFDKKRRGKGCRVFAFPRGNEVWFLIRHGEPFRREGTFDDGAASSVYYRPEKFDVLIYYCDLDGMAVHATTKGEKDLYQRAFGKHFFGNAGYFGPGGNYTLLPLLEEGTASLNCIDVEGLDWVRLKEVEVFCGNGLTVIYKAPDLFSKLGTGAEAALRSGFLTRAGFTVKFADSRTARSVSVRPPNRAEYTRDGDRLVLEQWMLKRRFMGTASRGYDDEPESVLASA